VLSEINYTKLPSYELGFEIDEQIVIKIINEINKEKN